MFLCSRVYTESSKWFHERKHRSPPHPGLQLLIHWKQLAFNKIVASLCWFWQVDESWGICALGRRSVPSPREGGYTTHNPRIWVLSIGRALPFHRACPPFQGCQREVVHYRQSLKHWKEGRPSPRMALKPPHDLCSCALHLLLSSLVRLQKCWTSSCSWVQIPSPQYTCFVSLVMTLSLHFHLCKIGR